MKLSRSSAAIAASVSSLALIVGLAAPASAAPPVSSTVMTCNKLAAATNPVAAFATPVSQRDPAVTELAVNPLVPGAEVIRTAGGLVCEWGNGVEIDGGRTTAPVGVHVDFLPYAASGYWRWASWLGPATTPEVFSCHSGYCQFATSAGGDFLIVGIQGSTSDAVAESLARRISTALQLGLKTPFVAPRYPDVLGPICDLVARPVVWSAATRAPAVRTFDVPPGWTPVNSAMLLAKAPACSYDDVTGSHSAGLLSTVPGGRWAFALLRSRLTTPGPLTPITVTGMRAGDAAFTRCDVAHNQCILDALIATHWVEVNLLPRTGGGDLIHADRLAALTPILEEIVLQIYTP